MRFLVLVKCGVDAGLCRLHGQTLQAVLGYKVSCFLQRGEVLPKEFAIAILTIIKDVFFGELLEAVGHEVKISALFGLVVEY